MTGADAAPDRGARGSHGRWATGALALLLALGGGAGEAHGTTALQQDGGEAAEARPVTDSLLRLGHRGDPGQWPLYGGDLAQTRFSPLTRIDTTNVSRLRPAWIYQTGITGTFELTPVVAGGALYVTSPMGEDGQDVARLDARTGEVLWRTTLVPDDRGGADPQDAHLPADFGPNRGVALYRGRVYLGTYYGTLAALDVETGEVAWEAETGAPRLTGAPLAYGGKVVIGLSFTDRGGVEAYDAATGEFAWRWWVTDEDTWWGEWPTTLPGVPSVSLERDIAEERADSARFAEAWRTGGGAAPMTPALDPELGLLYVSTGGPAPHGFPESVAPPGDYRWTNSICALRLSDGTQEWCYQVLPHDVWGASGPTPPILFTARTEAGEEVPAVGRFTGMGLFYTWDRRTGELLRISENYIPAEDRGVGPDRPNLVEGLLAGTVWSPGAYDPMAGHVYSVNRYWPGYFHPDEQAGPDERWGNVAAVATATGEVRWRSPTAEPMAGGALATAGGVVFAGQSTGTFDAWHARTGEHLWSFRAGAGCNAAPVTYELDDVQYVAVACGGHGLLDPKGGNAVIVFRLPNR